MRWLCIIALLVCAPLAEGQQQANQLTVTLDGSHWVQLTCTPSLTPGVLGYNFFRGTSAGQELATPLNLSPVAACSWADFDVMPGLAYFYTAASVLEDGTESGRSNEATATIPNP